jgi:hypothetical protein
MKDVLFAELKSIFFGGKVGGQSKLIVSSFKIDFCGVIKIDIPHSSFNFDFCGVIESDILLSCLNFEFCGVMEYDIILSCPNFDFCEVIKSDKLLSTFKFIPCIDMETFNYPKLSLSHQKLPHSNKVYIFMTPP